VTWRCEDPGGRARPELLAALESWTRAAEIVRTRTVTVERTLAPDGGVCVVKRYRFPVLGRRLEAAFRHTWLAVPKARREMRSLARLRVQGVPAVEPLGCGWRRDALGFVRDSFLLTRWWPHPDLAGLLAAREELPDAAWRAVGETLGALHARGVRHGGLQPRNLLLGPFTDGHWEARLLDPARARFGSAPLGVAAAARDLAPLRAVLARTPSGARDAFDAGYCNPNFFNSAASAGSTSAASPTIP
jgi:tRNA A-37 threonylcarbamoyl transferase component Bud32